MAARWRERVSEAERLQYGAGILGALLLFLSERRLPVSALRRPGARSCASAWASRSRCSRSCVAVLVAAGAVAVEILSAIF